jgi:hypothetical protein
MSKDLKHCTDVRYARVMKTHTRPPDVDAWTNPPCADERPEPGYEAYVREKVAKGIAQLDAGEGIPLEDVRKEFGLE